MDFQVPWGCDPPPAVAAAQAVPSRERAEHLRRAFCSSALADDDRNIRYAWRHTFAPPLPPAMATPRMAPCELDVGLEGALIGREPKSYDTLPRYRMPANCPPLPARPLPPQEPACPCAPPPGRPVPTANVWPRP
jgi:hypothetical protein